MEYSLSNMSFNKETMRHVSYIFALLIVFSALGCGKSEVKPLDPPSEAAQKFYLQSQKELRQGDYKQAYQDYQKAVAEDSDIANIAHLSSILYSWVISQSESEDVPLLEAQKWVWLEPNQLALREQLMAMAVDKERDVIHAFGIGLVPENIVISEQRRHLAHRSALADAEAWVARLATWVRDGIGCPFDVTDTVVGVETLKEFWVEDTIYVVRLKAPVNCLGRKIDN